MTKSPLTEEIANGRYDGVFTTLYGGESPAFHQKRWTELITRHQERVGDASPRLFSAPGRTELSGNHTDHNHGKVLAASVQLDTIAAVTLLDEPVAEVVSQGYPAVRINLSSLDKDKNEEGKTESLLRGIAAGIVARKGAIGGFTATTTSRVLKGSGLSSSAALEILVGAIMNELFNDGQFSAVDLALIGQEAENQFFGKPCGLLDQCACSIGGAVEIDFANPANPQITPLQANFAAEGYALAVVDTGGDHANLTPDYAAIPGEMKAIAASLGAEVLNDAKEEEFRSSIGQLRKEHGERAVLRALHFYSENHRVDAMAAALRNNEMSNYLKGVRSSGHSSLSSLQNIFSPAHPEHQGISLALTLTEEFLQGDGAVRVHGGGFAGTIQAYIPAQRMKEYQDLMEPVFGEGSVVPLFIRPLPAGELHPL
ncbi:MAG: galactokinase [Spirochaetales bacterium]|nr:galactokinase [Spirochaetales bacterium]